MRTESAPVNTTGTTESTKTVDSDLDEFQLIAVTSTSVARSRDFHEGLKAKASDVHNWNNRISL